MTKEEYFKFAEEFMNKMLEISKAKNSDYAGEGDPFANFKAVETFGIKTEQGFVTRMTDKMMRISNLIKKDNPAVKDESITDTLADLANYAILLAGYLKSKQ